jgi:hypothetical protein
MHNKCIWSVCLIIATIEFCSQIEDGKWIETKENPNFVSSSNVAYDTYSHMIPLININYSTILNYLTTTTNQLPRFNDYSF